jgi:CBS domain containing-hemolysin-like protein
MHAVERHWPLPKVLAAVRSSGSSRLPVYEEDLDHIVGILLAKDLLNFMDAPSPFRLDLVMREPFFIPATMQVDELLKELKRRNAHLAIVVDEYGGTLGLITLEDLLEEIVGEIFDEFDQAEEVASVQDTAEGLLRVSGDLPVSELNAELYERYHLKLPEGDYVTVAGLVLSALGHVPGVGEQVQVDGFLMHVTAMDGLRIERLDITLPDTANKPSSPAPDNTLA